VVGHGDGCDFTGHWPLSTEHCPLRLKSKAMAIRPLLLGHRGARAEKSVPENTLESFDLALGQGCDGFEFDVRLTADGQAVICHDATVGGLKIRGLKTRALKIAESSAGELALPLLREVLARYQGKAFLDIELKVPGLEAITRDLLRKSAPARGFVVSSFLPEVLRTMHDLDATIPLGFICETRAEYSRWPQLPVSYVIPHHKLAGPTLIREMKAAGKKILVWTVNSAADMKRFSKWGVDGVVSDHPKRMVRALGQQEKS
jgi:glycerophosphoryl diester phosphodiesterase